MGRSRRNKISNRRLPNSSRSSQRRSSYVGVPTSYRPTLVEELFPALTRKPRQLAKNVNRPQVSNFPKTFGGSTLTAKKRAEMGVIDKPYLRSDAPVRYEKVCVDRSQRKEILFATKKSGKAGQKSPIRTWKSKVRC